MINDKINFTFDEEDTTLEGQLKILNYTKTPYEERMATIYRKGLNDEVYLEIRIRGDKVVDFGAYTKQNVYINSLTLKNFEYALEILKSDLKRLDVNVKDKVW